MHTLVLMRHATAGMGPAGTDDADRVISPRGHREAGNASAWLRAHGFGPGPGRALLASAAVRARQTAEHLGGPVQLDRTLYNASEDTLLAAIREIPALRDDGEEPDTVVLVAHNPGIHRLAWQLAETAGHATVAQDGVSRPEPLSTFAPATMAIFTVTAGWSELRPGRAGLRRVVLPVPG